MFKHLFKLIWNKKKQNFLLIAEMLISFMVIFAVFSAIVYGYRNYAKPMGFEYEDVWVVNYNNPVQPGSTDSLTLFYETIRKALKSMPEVKDLSYASSNTPFSHITDGMGVSYKNIRDRSVYDYQVEESYTNVLRLPVLEGRWFEKQDAIAKNRPVVISSSLKKELFGKEDPLGKLVDNSDGKEQYRVIGVVNDIKDKGDYAAPGKAVFFRADTSAFRWMDKMLLRVVPGAGAAFESSLYKTLAATMKNSNIEIEHLANNRMEINRTAIIPMIIILVVAGFLIINVGLGLFGVLWYNINKRKNEIGLRRAIGASGRSVSMQLVSEALILATIALVIGLFFAVQFPLLTVFNLPREVYIIAMIFAVLFIYLLVLVCSLYPGRQAAAIYPAVALHED